MANDSDPDPGATLSVINSTISGSSSTKGGKIIGEYGDLYIAEDGAYTYVSKRDVGQAVTVVETFDYAIQDEYGAIGTGQLSLTVTGSNQAPRITNDWNRLIAPTSGSISVTSGNGVLLNDRDGDSGQSFHFECGVRYSRYYRDGYLRCQWGYTYNPNINTVRALGEGAEVSDTFAYTVSDGKGGTANGTLTLVLVGQNDAPVAVDDTKAWTESDSALQVTAENGVLANDEDTDGGVLSLVEAGTLIEGAFGRITFATDGSYSYSLESDLDIATGQVAKETFSYTVRDSNGAEDIGELTIEITGASEVPTLQSFSISIKKENKGNIENTAGGLSSRIDYAIALLEESNLANDKVDNSLNSSAIDVAASILDDITLSSGAESMSASVETSFDELDTLNGITRNGFQIS